MYHISSGFKNGFFPFLIISFFDPEALEFIFSRWRYLFVKIDKLGAG